MESSWRFDLLVAIYLAFATPGGAAGVTIPVTVRNGGTYEAQSVSLYVEVNGRLKMFDLATGEPRTRLVLDEQTRLWPFLSSDLSLGWQNETRLCRQTPRARVELAGAQRWLKHVTVCARGAGGNNVLGLDALVFQPFALEFRPARLTVNARPFRDAALQPLGYYNQRLQLPVALADLAVTGRFDTGAELSEVDARLVSARPDLFEDVAEPAHVASGDGRLQMVRVVKIKSVRIGDLQLSGVYALVRDARDERGLSEYEPMVVGMNVIARANWFIDPQHLRWAVQLL